MGVDFYVCEQCNESICEQAIELVNIRDYSKCWMCNTCIRNFTMKTSEELMDNEYHPYVFYARLNDKIYDAQTMLNLQCTLDEIEEEDDAINQYETTFINTAVETLNENTVWFPPGDHENTMNAAMDDFVKYLENYDHTLDTYEYVEYVPNNIEEWKRETLLELDAQIEQLETKKRKIINK